MGIRFAARVKFAFVAQGLRHDPLHRRMHIVVKDIRQHTDLKGVARIVRDHRRHVAMVQVEIFDNGVALGQAPIAVDKGGKLPGRRQLRDPAGIFRMVAVNHPKGKCHAPFIKCDQRFPDERGERMAVQFR
jgi:hypothetical protein